MQCQSCGEENPSENRFCNTCGNQLPGVTGAASAGPAAVPASAGPSGSPSIQASLERLGIRLSTRQLVGIAIATLAGIVVARVLPNVYPVLFAPILQVLFFGNPAGSSDSFNTSIMTWLTFLTSFVISLLIARSR
jgi:hypothetical protein